MHTKSLSVFPFEFLVTHSTLCTCIVSTVIWTCTNYLKWHSSIFSLEPTKEFLYVLVIDSVISYPHISLPLMRKTALSPPKLVPNNVQEMKHQGSPMTHANSCAQKHVHTNMETCTTCMYWKIRHTWPTNKSRRMSTHHRHGQMSTCTLKAYTDGEMHADTCSHIYWNMLATHMQTWSHPT